MSPISQVINDSISSAICIDDKYVTPYQEVDKKDNLEDSKTLYESFRKEGNCDLDIYKYESLKQFEEDKKYLFNNKDLLILDWELKDDGIKYADTLSIIESAMDTDYIQYITIYTNNDTPEEIALRIFSFFKYKQKDKDTTYDKYLNFPFLNSYFEETDQLEDIVKNETSGYVLNLSKRKDIRKIIVEKIKKIINNPEEFKALCKNVRECDINQDEIFEWFECYYSDMEMGVDEKKHDVQIISIDRVKYHSLLIDNTLITIIRKSKDDAHTDSLIKPEELYSTICSVIDKVPNRISTVLSLEIKNICKKHINTFGRGFMGIKEAAIVTHARKYDTKTRYEEFYDFILSCWNSQVTDKIKEEVKTLVYLESDIQSYSVKPNNADIAKLNSYLTFARHYGKKERRIKFGDIFQLEVGVPFFEDESTKEPDTVNYKYLICITQACDCLRPHKINSNFVFAIGKEIVSIEEALQKVETENYSFVNDNLVIEWQKKFLTVNHQTTYNFDPNKVVPFSINSTTINASYLGNQKETITQRLANSIYSNAMRVGIDLPHLSKN